LLPLPTKLGLVSHTYGIVQWVLMLYRSAYINFSTGGYKVAAPGLTHVWAPFSMSINALHDPYDNAYDPIRYSHLFFRVDFFIQSRY
jgi:hypothetical protein